MKNYSEDVLIKQPAIGLFELHDWRSTNCFHETFGTNGTLGRKTFSNVVLTPILREALIKRKQFRPAEAIKELICGRNILYLVNTNREIYSHAEWDNSLSKERSPDKPDVLDWDYEEDDGTVKTYIWLKNYDYLIVLKKYKNGGRRLITSFWIEYQNFRKKLGKKYEQRIR